MSKEDDAIIQAAKAAYAQGRDAFAVWWNAAGRDSRTHVIDSARHLLSIIRSVED
ncbi:hypothetical protein [Azospirillum sp. TSO5]|uniref:hypothetical protein n=1 Tax=Azospirillum sp. TSO5 TaxID=716760 RepID=UPI001304C68D|nr:hypothetical protein [Azospirillum sp. TSO5]